MCSVGLLTTDLHRRCVQWSTDYTDTVSSGAPTCTDGVLQWSTDYTDTVSNWSTDLHRRSTQWSTYYTDYTDTVSSGAPTCTGGVLQWSTGYTAADVTDTPISLTPTSPTTLETPIELFSVY
jgi:hypothetical protein